MMNERQWIALENVVSYLLDAGEEHSWEETGRPDDHIWLSVRELNDMLTAAVQ